MLDGTSSWNVAGTLALNLSPYWFLVAFILLLASSRGALLDRVPLYLSNRSFYLLFEHLMVLARAAGALKIHQ